MLSWVDKVTTATQRFAPVIENLRARLTIALATIKQFADQVRIRLIWQLTNGTSRVLQKIADVLMVPFLASFVPPIPVWPVSFCFNLNEAVLLLSLKSIIPPTAFKARSCL